MNNENNYNNIEIINKMIVDDCVIIDNNNDILSLCKVTTMEILQDNLIDSNKETKKNTNTQYKKNLYTSNEKSISVFLHIFIMALFETYFYFNYVIRLEKQMLINKINQYMNEVNEYYITHKNKKTELYINLLFKNFYEDNGKDYLKNKYEESKNNQELTLNKLKVFCYKLIASIFCFFAFFVICGFFHKKTKWKWILIENLCMFGLLGLFEYIFFINVILKYSPFSDDEFKYIIYKETFNILNDTYIEK